MFAQVDRVSLRERFKARDTSLASNPEHAIHTDIKGQFDHLRWFASTSIQTGLRGINVTRKAAGAALTPSNNSA
jgi:hypothetical protein